MNQKLNAKKLNLGSTINVGLCITLTIGFHSNSELVPWCKYYAPVEIIKLDLFHFSYICCTKRLHVLLETEFFSPTFCE